MAYSDEDAAGAYLREMRGQQGGAESHRKPRLDELDAQPEWNRGRVARRRKAPKAKRPAEEEKPR